MSSFFRRRRGLIVVRCELFGPQDSLIVRLALDTGATQTIIDDKLLRLVGSSPELSTEKVQS